MAEETKKMKRLSLKQEKFVDAFVENGGNATQAALVAYDCGSRANAAALGQQNLDRPHIKEIIDSKVKDLKNNTLDTMRNKDLIGLALDTAHSDLQDEDPKVRDSARKYILEMAKYLTESEKVVHHDNRTQNLVLPKWKGTTGKSE